MNTFSYEAQVEVHTKSDDDEVARQLPADSLWSWLPGQLAKRFYLGVEARTQEEADGAAYEEVLSLLKRTGRITHPPVGLPMCRHFEVHRLGS